MRIMMSKWKHVQNLLFESRNWWQRILLSRHSSWQSSRQKQFIPVQYRTFGLKLSKDFLRLWSLLYFQTFYYYLTLNHGQKMTLLALEIARSTSWLVIIWHFWKKNGCDVTKIPSKWTCLKKTYAFPILHNSPNKSYLKIWHRTFTNNEVMAECQNIMHIFEILIIVPFTSTIESKQTFVIDYKI